MQRSCVHLLAVSVLLAGSVIVTERDAGARELGIMLDAGVPDGANLSLAYSPLSWMRLHAGGGTNLIAPGFRTGLSLLLGNFVGTAEYGHYFEGNANGIWRTISGHPDADVPSLRELGYDYANFRLGVEIGPRRFKFQMLAGMSYLTGQVKELGATLTKAASSEGTTVSFATDPTVSVWTVSARVGFIVNFGL